MSHAYACPETVPVNSLLIVSLKIIELTSDLPVIRFLGFVSVSFQTMILFWSSPAAITLHRFGLILAQVKLAPLPTR